MMDPSLEGLIELAATINDLVKDNPMPAMAGMYPKTLRKASRRSAAYPASRSAPKKPAGYLSSIVVGYVCVNTACILT